MGVPPLTAPTVCALVLGALLLGALGAEDCPVGCSCNELPELDIECALPHANVNVKKESGTFQIICDDNSEEFTFEELPQMQYGLGQAIRLELRYCPTPPSFALAASRLGASDVEDLYIRYPLDGFNITGETVKGLDRLKGLNFYDTKKYNVTIPKEAFAQLPSLQRFTINNARLVVLGSEDFASAPGLVYLELSTCSIPQLPDGVFRPLTKLKSLNIWRNNLEDLTEAKLEGLNSLEELDISNNKLRSLRGLAATQRPLRKLSAFANSFEELPPLYNLSMLEKVKIIDNRERPLTLTPRALASLPRIQEVDLSRCGIQHLPADVFSDSPALKQLILKGNNLTELTAGVFRSQKKLELLDLTASNISRVDATVFRPLEALRRLTLDNNKLTILPSYWLSGLRSLRRLSVAHNRLQQLTAAMFSGADNLENINLSYNNISDPDNNNEAQYQLFAVAFMYLNNLTAVNLSHNRLAYVPDSIIAKPFLESLDLSYNRIKEVYYLSIYSNKATLDLRHNSIQTITLEKATNKSGVVPQPAADRSQVLIDDNPFQCDCNLYNLALRFHGFTPLNGAEGRLMVSEAKCASPPSVAGRLLTKIPLRDFVCDFTDESECPNNCTCVVRLYTAAFEITCKKPPPILPNLKANGLSNELKLTEIPTFLDTNADIRTLNLSGLALRDMPAVSLPQNLTTLDVSNNNLSSIPRDLLDKRMVLKIARNPLICDCWHADDIAAIQEHWWKIEDYEQVNCSSNIAISQVNVEQLCSTWRAGVVGGVLALLGLLAAVIAVLLLKYSFEIKVWLYARGMFARWLVVDDDDRKYDAFVSFCHKDEDFVSEHLLPGLENVPQPYKLCIHYRDWMPGEFITTQIAKSVADSRRTIIVVSQNFLESQWARAEFRTANMTAIKERKTRVIAILLDDVNSHKELDPELKAYLSTNTYLKWGDPWFWDKLRYALPHRKADDVRRQRIEGKSARVAQARADEARKVVRACGLDTRLTADGVIINAAALALPTDNKKCEQINLDIRQLNKIKTIEDMKPIQV